MRNSRDRWVFFKHPSKPAITSEEVQYWKNNLRKILKVGLEFEFNLPSNNGNCKGNSGACPCRNVAQGNCWKQCTKQEECSQKKDAQTCANFTDKCSDSKCKECGDYTFLCHGTSCTSFVTACYHCDLFNASCEDCKHKYNPLKNPDKIRDSVTAHLQPNNSYGVINKSGVHSIVTDGSLLGNKGMEVVTIGRRIDFWEFYKMSKEIIDESVGRGAYVNERCSIHMHVLASYYSKLFNNQEQLGVPKKINELEKEMPEIVLANFHQLCRRYQNAMTWMMMGLDEPERMTRWEKFRVSILEVSPIMSSMQQVKDTVRHVSGGNKYGWVNYNYTEFDPSGNISRFHVEMRALDGILCPSAVAAFACLYYALVIKAVEISKYGIVEVGDKEWLEQARKVKNTVLNNMKGYQDGDRFGDTRHIHKYREVLVAESLDLIRQLKHILIEVGPAYPILEQLAERPVALRRCDGDTWEAIENTLAVPVKPEDTIEHILNEYIDLRIVAECTNIMEWIEAVTNSIRQEEIDFNESVEALRERVSNYITDKSNDGELIWSGSLGAVVKI